MNTLQIAFQVVGYGILALVAFMVLCSFVTSSIKQIITHYFSTKKVYAESLLQNLAGVPQGMAAC